MRGSARSLAESTGQADLDDFAVTKLVAAGFSDEFIARAKLSSKLIDPAWRGRVHELNLLGFLKRGNYDIQYSEYAVRRCIAFAKQHAKVLRRMEEGFLVDPFVAVALLWVETKFAEVKGSLPIAGVFFLLVQVDHPAMFDSLMGKIREDFPKDYREDVELPRKLRDRMRIRAELGLNELRALNEMRTRFGIDIFAITGSFAGAFGIPQFLPSSYLKWSSAYAQTATPDLFLFHDAIMSVGSYLHANGWKSDNDEAMHDALFHYNRSEGYVRVIRKLGEAVRGRMNATLGAQRRPVRSIASIWGKAAPNGVIPSRRLLLPPAW